MLNQSLAVRFGFDDGRDLQKDSQDSNDNAANREIDVETPSPGNMRCKCTAEQGPNDRGDAIDGAKDAVV